MLRKLAFFWIFVVSVVALLPVLAQDDEVAPDDGALTLKTQINDAVLAIPSLDRVLFVTQGTLNDESGDFVEIAYNTDEIGLYGYYAEVMDVFRAVGETLDAQDPPLRLERIALTPTVGEHSPIETMIVPGDVLRMFVGGAITRSEFLDRVESFPGAHQSPSGDEASSA